MSNSLTAAFTRGSWCVVEWHHRTQNPEIIADGFLTREHAERQVRYLRRVLLGIVDWTDDDGPMPEPMPRESVLTA